MRSLVSSAQRALFRYAGWTAFAAAIANVSVQPAAAQAPYGFGGVTAAGLPVSSQSSSGGGIEHYSPFTGALGMSVPLYHVGGRAMAALTSSGTFSPTGSPTATAAPAALLPSIHTRAATSPARRMRMRLAVPATSISVQA